MRDYGNNIIPALSALPPSGVSGQLCSVASQIYYWNVAQGQWNQIDDWYESLLGADYTNSTTTLSNVLSFPVAANGIYAVEFTFQWKVSSLVGMKVAFTAPTGCTFVATATVSGTASGVTAPTYLELNTSGTAQNGPTAAVTAANSFALGKGLFTIGTSAGSVSLQSAATTLGTVTIAKGAILKARRVL